MSAPDNASKQFKYLLRMGRLYMLRKSIAGLQSAFEIARLCDALSSSPCECGDAVKDGCAVSDIGDLAIEASCHDAFAQQLEAMHLRFDQAALAMAAPLLPDCPAAPSA